ncbi:MAG: deoxyribose-phosphate aldolase [Treponema sp.]|nr:MAG: deoxyribose-phosphate aldolase [Treponema sp.]
MTKKELAGFIDHTLLKPTATKEDIKALCEEAKTYSFASVCVNPCNVALAYNFMKESNIKVCSVVGFPFGANSIEIKFTETKKALEDGAAEIDMVINVGKLLEGDVNYVKNEISFLADACHKKNAILKVIVETCYLEEKDFEIVCNAVEEAGADFIKTSTGYGSRGASKDDIHLFKKYLKANTKIKASGGIRSFEDAKAYIDLGCSRLGTSRGITLLKECE